VEAIDQKEKFEPVAEAETEAESVANEETAGRGGEAREDVDSSAATQVAYNGGHEEQELTAEERVELEQLLEKDDAQRVVMQRSMFSGPLPPPSILEGYNGVLDGGAERIMRLTEREQEHRHYMEKTAVTGHIRLDRRGQYLGFGVAIIALLSATYLISTGNVISGTIIGTLDLVGLVGAFVYGRHIDSKKDGPSDDNGER